MYREGNQTEGKTQPPTQPACNKTGAVPRSLSSSPRPHGASPAACLRTEGQPEPPHLFSHFQESLVAALPARTVHCCLFLQLLDFLSHLQNHSDKKGTNEPQAEHCSQLHLVCPQMGTHFPSADSEVLLSWEMSPCAAAVSFTRGKHPAGNNKAGNRGGAACSDTGGTQKSPCKDGINLLGSSQLVADFNTSKTKQNYRATAFPAHRSIEERQTGSASSPHKRCWAAKALPTFSISCLNVVNTSLLLERVFWNSSNFSV